MQDLGHYRGLVKWENILIYQVFKYSFVGDKKEGLGPLCNSFRTKKRFNSESNACSVKLVMFTQLPFRIVAVLFVSILVGALSVRVATRPADMFFLDWRQILANGKAPKVPIKVIDISGTDAKSKDRERVDNAKLAEVLENISRHKPRAIFLTLSKNEIQIEMNSVEWRRLLSIENLYLLTDRVSQAGAQGLNTHPVLKDFPRLLYFETTWDTKIDNVSRRIILYYDTKKSESHMSQIFKMTRDYAGNSFPPEYFKKSFEYVGTEQIYLKIWPDEKFDEVKLEIGRAHV